MNALEDRQIIEALYAASAEGVEIDLIVRGICRLRPGLPGRSETIRVISIVGRFLEHARIFYFANAGKPEFFLGSADWMSRNLDFRVESIVPAEEPRLQEELKAILDLTPEPTGETALPPSSAAAQTGKALFPLAFRKRGSGAGLRRHSDIPRLVRTC